MSDHKWTGREPSPLEDSAPEHRTEKAPPTSKGKRILALIGAILVILLTFAYTYSLATGSFFKW